MSLIALTNATHSVTVLPNESRFAMEQVLVSNVLKLRSENYCEIMALKKIQMYAAETKAVDGDHQDRAN